VAKAENTGSTTGHNWYPPFQLIAVKGEFRAFGANVSDLVCNHKKVKSSGGVNWVRLMVLGNR